MSDVVEKNYKSRQDFEDLLVHGYTRNMQKEITNVIPQPITIVCLAYHGLMDYFSIPGKYTKISGNGLIVTRNENVSDSYDNTSYGSKWIPSNQDIIIKWTLRILCNESRGIGIFIGIYNSDLSADKPFFTDDKNIYYAWQNETRFYFSKNGYSTISYGEMYGEDDVIVMELNLKLKTIEFYKNGESQGIAFKDIVKNDDTRYKLFISMFSERDSVQIVNFEKKRC